MGLGIQIRVQSPSGVESNPYMSQSPYEQDGESVPSVNSVFSVESLWYRMEILPGKSAQVEREASSQRYSRCQT